MCDFAGAKAVSTQLQSSPVVDIMLWFTRSTVRNQIVRSSSRQSSHWCGEAAEARLGECCCQVDIGGVWLRNEAVIASEQWPRRRLNDTFHYPPSCLPLIRQFISSQLVCYRAVVCHAQRDRCGAQSSASSPNEIWYGLDTVGRLTVPLLCNVIFRSSVDSCTILCRPYCRLCKMS